MALYSQVNDYGFLEAPYKKVIKQKKGKKEVAIVTDEIVYMSADEERDQYITHAGVSISDSGEIQDARVPQDTRGTLQKLIQHVIELYRRCSTTSCRNFSFSYSIYRT